MSIDSNADCRPAILDKVIVGPGGIPAPEQFNEVFARVNISGEQINRDNYPPGSGGAVRRREELKAQIGLQ